MSACGESEWNGNGSQLGLNACMLACEGGEGRKRGKEETNKEKSLEVIQP